MSLTLKLFLEHAITALVSQSPDARQMAGMAKQNWLGCFSPPNDYPVRLVRTKAGTRCVVSAVFGGNLTGADEPHHNRPNLRPTGSMAHSLVGNGLLAPRSHLQICPVHAFSNAADPRSALAIQVPPQASIEACGGRRYGFGPMGKSVGSVSMMAATPLPQSGCSNDPGATGVAMMRLSLPGAEPLTPPGTLSRLRL